ncbi:MAG: diaminopimelate epimerase [Burkholderiales bacterium]
MIRFTKMHGAGNDFVVIDCISQRVNMTRALARAIADRHRGVGCDQLLLVESAPSPDVDFRYRIFNADGGEVEQCGNGARCFVRFVHEQKLTTKRSIRVLTTSGVIMPRLEDDGTITVDMGPPIFATERVPFDAKGIVAVATSHGLGEWPLDVNGRTLAVTVLSMGNPHAVQIVADVDRAPVEADGPAIEGHARFPRRVNAGFMEVLDRGHIRLRVYERGAGETLACGTGACAAVVSGILQGRLDSPVAVDTRGGRLTIAWAGVDNSVLMTGPAESVYAGEFDPRTII